MRLFGHPANEVTDAELEAYLDESLPQQRMAELEQALRDQEDLRKRLLKIIDARNAGTVSIGDVWRTYRVSCPTRDQLGAYLLGALDPDTLDYVKFHITEIACPYCAANLEDLESQRRSNEQATGRRSRLLESSLRRIRSKRRVT